MDDRLRLNRFSYDPIIDKDGKALVARITPHDEKRFIAISPYDYLTADYWAGLTGGKEDAVTNRQNLLKRTPNRWVDIAAPQLEDQFTYKSSFLAYTNSARAKKWLEDHCRALPSHGCTGPFIHRLMAGWMRASFDIAVEQERVNATIIPFHEIIKSDNTPEATRNERTDDRHDHRHQIPVTFDGKTRRITPDAFPFAVRDSQGKHSLIFLEADCDSESIDTPNGLDLKLKQYLEAFRRRDGEHDTRPIFRQRYGFRQAYVVFGTPGRIHLENVMAHLVELTKDTPKLREHFLFTEHPSLKSKNRPSATGHMLTNPYRRAGLPDFSLLTGEEVPNGHREIKGPDRKTRANRRRDTGGSRGEEGARI
jgi:hypothetical protein